MPFIVSSVSTYKLACHYPLENTQIEQTFWSLVRLFFEYCQEYPYLELIRKTICSVCSYLRFVLLNIWCGQSKKTKRFIPSIS